MIRPIIALTTAAVAVGTAQALDNGQALTPPMGWNPWSTKPVMLPAA